jgi:hypothetical protein
MHHVFRLALVNPIYGEKTHEIPDILWLAIAGILLSCLISMIYDEYGSNGTMVAFNNTRIEQITIQKGESFRHTNLLSTLKYPPTPERRPSSSRKKGAEILWGPNLPKKQDIWSAELACDFAKKPLSRCRTLTAPAI